MAVQKPSDNKSPLNVLLKVPRYFVFWIKSLFGMQASKPTVQADAGVQEKQEGVGGDLVEEDSVAGDIQTAKNVAKKLSGEVSKAIGSKTANLQIKPPKLAVPVGTFNKDLIKKIVKILFILILILLLLILALRFLQRLREKEDEISQSQPTPTSAPFIPSRPSVYAQDEEVTQLEKDNNVLDSELSTTPLRETQLEPPVLDFSVSF